jgi:hypothetical protein
MKRAGLLVAAVLLLMMGVPLFAQQAGTAPAANTATAGTATTDAASNYPKDVYYKVVSLLKVWTGQLGYMVQFFNSKYQVVNVYIPMAWFNNGPTSKADIIYGREAAYPYMSIYWADGKFDHVKLYVTDDATSLKWGVLSSNVDMAEKFNVQEIPRDF